MKARIETVSVRTWQEQLFACRQAHEQRLKAACRIMEVAALGYDDQIDHLLQAAHLMEQTATEALAIAERIRAACVIAAPTSLN